MFGGGSAGAGGASDGEGIQVLLKAEQEAQRIVGDARKAKQERLKQAKAEAERDIAAYRAQRETGFQQALANQGTDSTSAAAQLDAETDAEVAEVRREAASRAPAVARMLADVVTGA